MISLPNKEGIAIISALGVEILMGNMYAYMHTSSVNAITASSLKSRDRPPMPTLSVTFCSLESSRDIRTPSPGIMTVQSAPVSTKNEILAEIPNLGNARRASI
jgi:hypothetical protein